MIDPYLNKCHFFFILPIQVIYLPTLRWATDDVIVSVRISRIRGFIISFKSFSFRFLECHPDRQTSDKGQEHNCWSIVNEEIVYFSPAPVDSARVYKGRISNPYFQGKQISSETNLLHWCNTPFILIIFRVVVD